MANGTACQENIKDLTYQNDAPLWLDKGCFAIVVTVNTITQVSHPLFLAAPIKCSRPGKLFKVF